MIKVGNQITYLTNSLWKVECHSLLGDIVEASEKEHIFHSNSVYVGHV